MFLSPPGPQDLDSPEATSFMEAYRAKYQGDPASVWAVLAGDAFKVIIAPSRAQAPPRRTRLPNTYAPA